MKATTTTITVIVMHDHAAEHEQIRQVVEKTLELASDSDAYNIIHFDVRLESQRTTEIDND